MRTAKELEFIKISTIINFLFGIIGIAFAIFTSSASILFDGLYSFYLVFLHWFLQKLLF